ncbi:MAG: carbon-phosphorus lyase complex subunit PhnI [Coriobacteriales bacterium]|jgi:alpha-D-ribose 1-methylphosphonate 5-triphosphate synthase subunit PhnI|nr:carbon-phosphorus lyase complex subunit PhnI [Coriobacteriales bacterium]
MAYVAVSGGEEAIAASLGLLCDELHAAPGPLPLDALAAAVPELIDQVMGEGSLYAPRLAALALRQGGGSVEEAVFLLRAFRSTLERSYASRVVETDGMQVSRRISAAFKDVPGGQLLGLTRDYSHRLLDFTLDVEAAPAAAASAVADVGTLASAPRVVPEELVRRAGFSGLPRVSAYLVEQGLMVPPAPDDTEPCDVTMEPLSFPAPRSARLQTLARGMTQAVLALGYAAIRGFGPAHPTVGELCSGSVEVLVDHPLCTGGSEDACYLGSVPVTEVESLFEVEDAAGGALSLDIGYGMVLGRCESKAIAMSVLDHCLERTGGGAGDGTGGGFPTEDEEFVLLHVDGVEATGFVSHLKLPHYVTFQSKLDSVRTTRAQGNAEREPDDDMPPPCVQEGSMQEPDDLTEGGVARGTDV